MARPAVARVATRSSSNIIFDNVSASCTTKFIIAIAIARVSGQEAQLPPSQQSSCSPSTAVSLAIRIPGHSHRIANVHGLLYWLGDGLILRSSSLGSSGQGSRRRRDAEEAPSRWAVDERGMLRRRPVCLDVFMLSAFGEFHPSRHRSEMVSKVLGQYVKCGTAEAVMAGAGTEPKCRRLAKNGTQPTPIITSRLRAAMCRSCGVDVKGVNARRRRYMEEEDVTRRWRKRGRRREGEEEGRVVVRTPPVFPPSLASSVHYYIQLS